MSYTPHTKEPGEIQLFTHPSFGTIRTAGDADNPLFCLTDVCKALGLQARFVRQRLDDDVVSNNPIPDRLGRMQNVNFINEDGLYDVIFDSRKPEAKAFRKWVTSVVLPSIRKTGGYGKVSTPTADDYLRRLISGVVEEAIRRCLPALTNNMIAPVDCDCSKKAWSLGELAKELGVDSYYLKCLLASIRVIKGGSGRSTIVCTTRSAQCLFANLPYEIRLYGGIERYDGILVTKLGRDTILESFSTYMKQHPYI